MAFDHGGLDGMQGIAAREPLNGDEMPTLQLMGWGDAGISAVIVKTTAAAWLSDGDRARTAVARGAAFLGAGCCNSLRKSSRMLVSGASDAQRCASPLR